MSKMYADYSYYSKVYHGKISENDYTPYAEKAGAYIDNRTDFLFEKMVCLLREALLHGGS